MDTSYINNRLARGNKVAFVLVNVAFVVMWISICRDLIQHWRLIDHRVRNDVEFVTTMFLFVWIDMLANKAKPMSLGLVFFSLCGVWSLVVHLF